MTIAQIDKVLFLFTAWAPKEKVRLGPTLGSLRSHWCGCEEGGIRMLAVCREKWLVEAA